MPAQRGQTYISVIIAMAIILILGHAIFSLVAASYELIAFTRSRVTARHIAQRQVELIRNMPYNEIGTQGGIPSGDLEQEQQVSANGQEYTLNTNIFHVDDPYDGLSPADGDPADYKRVRVEVSWGGTSSSRNNPVALMTDISPSTNIDEGGGTLSILVFDANGQPVQGVDVHVIANTISPQVDAIYTTDIDGKVVLPGAQPCDNCYFIEVTKEGYSSDKTYTTSEVANPNKPLQSVLEENLTEISFAIDSISSLTVRSYGPRDDNFPSLSGIEFTITGEKTIGTDTTGNPVYKINNTYTTEADGSFLIEQIEWDNYEIVPTEPAFLVTGTNPTNPFLLAPGVNDEFLFSLAGASSNSLLGIFLDPTDQLVASVSAELRDSGGQAVATVSSGIAEDPDFGHSFFPDLTVGLYELTATASGYVDTILNINISGNQTEEIYMNPE